MDKNVKRVNKLIIDIGKGKIKSLDKLFLEFGGLFFLMAKKYLFDKSYAEDLVSDIFLKLVKNSKNFKPEENGLNWLFKSIKNAAININLRNNRLKMENIENHFEIYDIYCEEDLYNSILIKDALEILDFSEKRIMQLKFWEGLTVREISIILKKPVATTQRQITAILEKMKNKIQGK